MSQNIGAYACSKIKIFDKSLFQVIYFILVYTTNYFDFKIINCNQILGHLGVSFVILLFQIILFLKLAMQQIILFKSNWW